MNNSFKISLLFSFVLDASFVQSQSPAFHHLNTSNGLSDNNVNTVRRDRNGILWIGTSEGLNSFDGNQMSSFYKYQHPQLPDNNIRSIEIDRADRIWLRTNSEYVVMIDGKRQFHSIHIGDSNDNAFVTAIFETNRYGMIAQRGKSQYALGDGSADPKKIKLPDQVVPTTIDFFGSLDDNKVFFYGDDRLVVYDYFSSKTLLNIALHGLVGGVAINDKEILAYPVTGAVFYRVNTETQKVIAGYKNLVDQEHNKIAGNLRDITRISNDRFAISSRFSGVYILNISDSSLQHWYHDPLEPRSIGGNNAYRIHYDTSGYLFVTTQTSGLHFVNMNRRNASSKSYFKDDRGEVFDGYIECITVSKDGSLIMGAQDRLIKWDRQNNKTTFIHCRLPDGRDLHGEETIRAVEFDDAGNLWVGTTRFGILVLDPQFKTIDHIKASGDSSHVTLPSNWINGISTDTQGQKWIATLRGLCIIKGWTHMAQNLYSDPVLQPVSRLHCSGVWFDKAGQTWIGSVNGVWCFSPGRKTLKHFDATNGLANNWVLAFAEDDIGNYYFGTPSGLTVLDKNETLYTYNRSNGLRNDKCEDILKDKQGFVWIGNLSCILRFDPSSKRFVVFEEGHGISQSGFRMRTGYHGPNGEMFWGSDKGLTWFYPRQMNELSFARNPVISSLGLRDTVYRFTANQQITLPYDVPDFSFHFSSGDLAEEVKTHYAYRLKGFDDEWKAPLIPGQVSFSNLTPGDYSFQLRASGDGINWTYSNYNINVVIATPWWQQWWFQTIVGLAIVGIGLIIYRWRRNRKKAKEIQKMIDYFAISGYEHSSVDDILWDIARNCISRLAFEDCVIYILDQHRNVLIQKAAHGPKSPKEFEISNPIEIPVGRGIVGSVAQTGIASVINDTTKDSRYIVDDERRFSEITVPIIHDEKVIGVIDSEDRRKSFYTKQQLNALQSIASICSAKISRAMALDAMKKSKAELSELNVRMAESKFLNLRLQMNPHFLFNSLNAIQHLIVSQQTGKAYKYLTVFSNFLRSLLHYAEENFIPLDEEVKILRMYIELESLRFDQSFEFDISVEEGLSNERVLVPSLMIQPFAENAIWHGLLHKPGGKRLLIRFFNETDEYLTCVIEDNGIGREKAFEIGSNRISTDVHQSKGITIIRERLSLLEKKTGKPAHFVIDDLYDDTRQAAGTRVNIMIPFYFPEHI